MCSVAARRVLKRPSVAIDSASGGSERYCACIVFLPPMDPQDLDHINQLLDHDVNLREVTYLSPIRSETKSLIIRSPSLRKSKTRPPNWIRKRVQWLDYSTRSILHQQMRVRFSLCAHTFISHSNFTWIVPALIESVRPVLHSCKDVNAGLVELIPPSQFWRWKDQWANALRTAIFSASLVEYLATGKLISLSTASEVLGSESVSNPLLIEAKLYNTISVREEWSDRLAISAEDYLHGIISLVNELVGFDA